MIWIVSYIDVAPCAGKNVRVGARDLGGSPTGRALCLFCIK